MTKATEHRVVVAWAGPGQPITLTVHGPDGKVAVPMVPKRALTLAQELLTRGVQVRLAHGRRSPGKEALVALCRSPSTRAAPVADKGRPPERGHLQPLRDPRKSIY